MVEALEREIELLKELQHENIVQYLGEWGGFSVFPADKATSRSRVLRGLLKVSSTHAHTHAFPSIRRSQEWTC
jgi:hypothetical protein